MVQDGGATETETSGGTRSVREKDADTRAFENERVPQFLDAHERAFDHSAGTRASTCTTAPVRSAAPTAALAAIELRADDSTRRVAGAASSEMDGEKHPACREQRSIPASGLKRRARLR